MITGVSSGFGRLLADAALKRGDQVVGTLRRGAQAAEFEALAPGRAHAAILDVTERAKIASVIKTAVHTLGGLDILVNNAGFGLVGALEELSDDEIDACLETNLVGMLYATRAALPALRDSRGVIINFSSLAGLVGIPGLSVYCAAKHAVEGLSESLHHELSPLGVHVMVVEPGAFRTNFALASVRTPERPLATYDATPAGMTRSGMKAYGGSERGDPRKAIEAILKAADAPKPPLRLLLGPDTLKRWEEKLASLQSDIDAWKPTTLGTDFVAA